MSVKLYRKSVIYCSCMHCKVELRSCSQDPVTHKTGSIYYLALYREKLPTFAVKDSSM